MRWKTIVVFVMLGIFANVTSPKVRFTDRVDLHFPVGALTKEQP
jgi:hypothetical protein